MLSTIAILLAVQSKPTPADLAVEIPEVTQRGVKLPFYYPEVLQETFDASSSFVSTSEAEDLETGRYEIMKRLGIKGDEFAITHSNKDAAGVLHIYAVEKVNGIAVDNHAAAVHIQNGAVLAFSSSFKSSRTMLKTKSIAIAPPSPPMALEEAVKVASAQLGAPQDSFPAKLVYVSIPNGDLVLAHQFQLRDDEKALWYQVSVDAATGKVVQAIDFYNDLTIKAVALPKLQSTDGFNVIQDSFSASSSSPNGWNNDGNRDYTDTQGNNLISSINRITTEGGAKLDFTNFTWNGAEEPDTENNKKAAIINNFYLSNVLHDISYQYGFDEASGNFQTSK
jgi:Zn-dependent metalloprotease